ncbi:M1 family aminopeptidase [Candidatus Jettenia sp. AMX1]|uniref:M1 family metallopeptidase n=1 Tax=Candidatus Jettenia sp. AMX1 TaxID=2293637 RepID=UPI002554D910|nr:M1 family aminopeptidase [Candidatus Jettenia sp. AMX1]MDL1939590.1 M1 family metallopeptidase [Candidatus Jettenia sp. AMX1]
MFNLRSAKNILLFVYFTIPITMLPVNAEAIHKSKIVNHTIEIELFLKDHKLKAIDHMSIPYEHDEKVLCFMNRSFQILSVSTSKRTLDFHIRNTPDKGPQCLEISIPSDLRERNELTLDIVYEGSLTATPVSLEEEDVGETTGTISERGVYLSPACIWYPDIPSSLATFKITIITPIGYEAITQGTLISKTSDDHKTYTTWEEKNVSEGCDLVAGKYQVTSISHNGIDIYAFFFPEEQDLAKTYLDATIRYLDMYQKLLGNYPYRKFAIVENFFQTGYGMPSFTLLGSTVVKLPFIVDTSLGHEILHNWWGNSVFVDESQGNWCEGLTTYMADYYYKELKDSNSAVTEQNDLPLSKFTGRIDPITQSVGYGKTAMVFHMLRRMVGDELFYTALRNFYKNKIWQQASWKDIQHTFEDIGKTDLSWFFEQWVNRKGAPFIELGKTEVEKVSDGWLVKAEILQKDTPYRLSIPVILELEDGNFSTTVELKETSNTFSIQTKSQPKYIAIDPQHDVFRRLHPGEIPPTIDLVLGDYEKVIVYPTGGESASQKAYKKLAESIADNEGMVKADTEVTETEITQKSLFILGGLSENKLTKMLLGDLPENFLLEENAFTVNSTTFNNKGNALLVTLRNPQNRKKGIALFLTFNSATIDTLGLKIPRYGKYSYLIFADGKNIDKGTFTVTDSPLQRDLRILLFGK